MIVSGRGQRPGDGEEPAGSRGGRAVSPVRSGPVPSLADGFSARTETAADLGAALAAGAAVVLVPVPVAGEKPGGRLEACGIAQLGVSVAESFWRSRRDGRLGGCDAPNRATV